jgi:toxin ParE1/3/4
MVELRLSRRALLDIADIEADSIEKWGENVASEYLQSIQDALNLLRNQPALLRVKPNVSKSLCFYRVRKHFLVFAAYEEILFVLTVKHGALDLPNRVAEIEPQLLLEAAILYEKWKG